MVTATKAAVVMAKSEVDIMRQSSTEVMDKPSSTETALVGMFRAAEERAKMIAARWDERVKKEGKRVWVSPLDPARPQHQFKTKVACDAFVKKNFKQQFAEAKKAKAPAATYMSRELIIPPKHKITDGMAPEEAAGMIAAREVAKEMRKHVQTAQRAGTKDMKTTTLANSPEGIAITELPKLTDEQLGDLFDKAYYGGKVAITRACRKEMKRRGLSTAF